MARENGEAVLCGIEKEDARAGPYACTGLLRMVEYGTGGKCRDRQVRTDRRSVVMRPVADHVRQRAIELRERERLSLSDIARMLNIGKSTAARMLRDHPLSQAEIVAAWGQKVQGTRRFVFDLTGQEFGRLTAQRPDYSPRRKKDTFWRCTCKSLIKNRR
jgi:hypothetical protein